ncbi:MAG: S8 family serine peptidase [Planctomycetota bacterium]
MIQLPILFALGALAPAQDAAPAAIDLQLASQAFDRAVAAKGAVQRTDAPSALEAELDTSRLALFLPEAGDDGATARSLVEAAGLTPAHSRRVASVGWYLVDLAQPLGDDAQVAERVADLAARPGVATASPVLAGARDTFGVPTQEILVRAKLADRERALELVPAWAEVVTEDFAGLDGALMLRVDLPDGGLVLEAARQLAQSDLFEWVEPRLLFSGGGASTNDTYSKQQWAFENTGADLGDGFFGLAGFDMNLDEVANFTTGDASVGVLVIDVGVDDNHPDLSWSLGIDLMGGTAGLAGSNQNVCDLHGTWVAGVTSALRDNNEGIAGIVPDSPLVSARSFESLTTSCDGSWTTFIGNTAASLDYGFNNGVRVSVNSNWYGFTDASIDAKYAETLGNGMVHFAAAGNFSTSGVQYPARLDDVIAVGGTDNFGTTYGFTALEDKVDFGAPGYNVYTTALTGTGSLAFNYEIVQGTSFAAPNLGGLAAALLAVEPTLTQDDVRRVLRAASVEVISDGVNAFQGKDVALGYGQPDALVALEIVNGDRAGLASTDGNFIDTWNGGTTNLEVFTIPPVAAGTLYYVLGTTSGTQPGIPFLGDIVPLNFDDYFTQTLNAPNSATTPGSLGFLDANGRGSMDLNVPSGVITPVELLMHHAVLILDVVPVVAYATGTSAARSTAVSNTSIIEATSSLPAAIPDNDPTGITRTVDVSGIGTSITQLNLLAELPHTYAGDVRIELTSPAGTTVLIWDADGSNFANLSGVWGYYFGTIGDITAFNGQNPNGTWTIKVSDNASLDTGTLEGWSLAITSL